MEDFLYRYQQKIKEYDLEKLIDELQDCEKSRERNRIDKYELGVEKYSNQIMLIRLCIAELLNASKKEKVENYIKDKIKVKAIIVDKVPEKCCECPFGPLSKDDDPNFCSVHRCGAVNDSTCPLMTEKEYMNGGED